MTVNSGIAIVTGGAKRIGRAIAEDLAAHGWSVVIHYNHSKIEADSLAKAIAAGGATAATVGADFADPGCVAGFFDAVEAALGKPHLLVNNASMFVTDEGGSLDRALYDRQMQVNLTTPVFLIEEFARRLPAGVEGNVVNLIDQSVWRPTPLNFSYQISKEGLWAATKMYAQALAPRIRVNGISPGPTLKNEAQTDEEFRRRVETVILRRGPELGEFGRTIRYLVETRSITGQMIGLDGGQHLAWQTPDVTELD